MTCPKCGSVEVVSKAEAWDAACAIPPKAQKKLERFDRIVAAARDLIVSSPFQATEEVPSATVPAPLLEALREAFQNPEN